jgi:DNA-binding response OmpR family regulator
MKRVLSVGHCGFDNFGIGQTIHRHFAAEVLTADFAQEALDALGQGDISLVLVNRVLDADGSAGMDLIKRIKADPALGTVPVMLVSNFEDAQKAAVEAGAVPGFGKAALGHPPTIERLKRYLA